ncbi:MAG TPA: FtsQ-type POTRA domain-containing protein [Solirubrobacteraceae bacterium]
MRRLGPARVAAVLLAAALLGGGWLWLRDSSLVAVRHVEITGISGPDSGRIRAALTAAAHTMTTLDLQRSRLQIAVAPYPAVKSIRVATDFPHGLRIHVVEELPSAILTAGGRRILVSTDGTVLRGATAKRALPVLPARGLPVGTRITDRDNRQELAVLAAAPPALAARAAGVLDTAAHGIVVKLRTGPSLYFGTVRSLHAKWIAATAVLATPSSQGAAYIDLSDPSRPAAG